MLQREPLASFRILSGMNLMKPHIIWQRMSDSFYCMTKTHVREKIYLEVSFSRTKEPRLKRLPFDLIAQSQVTNILHVCMIKNS